MHRDHRPGDRRRRLRALGELAALGSVTDAEAAAVAAVDVLASYRADVPAALLYLCDDQHGRARLVAAEGVVPGGPLAPATVDGDGFWAPVLHEVLATGRSTVVTGLAAALPDGRLGGAGPLRPGLLGGDRHDEAPFDTAVVLPLGTGVGRPPGVLVAGVSAYLPLDDEYRAFLELVSHHVSTATVAAGAFAAQQRRAEHLTELDRTKTAFFAGISDQFRTPLTLVLGPVAELRDAAAPGSALRADLELVHRNAQRLRRMVDRLLELSRLYAGQVDPHLEPVDLAPLTTGLVDMFRPAIEHAGLSLDLDCPDLGEPAVVDRAMWEQVVPALLAHALAVASDGCITVRLRRRNGTAVLRVAATGATRAEPEDGGVGLALVAELVGLLGGSVTTDGVGTGRTGAGFAVDVAVPLGRDHLPAAGISGNHPELRAESVAEALWWLPDAGDPPVGSPPSGTDDPDAGRILVVDDHADMRAYLVRLLGRAHRVETAADGEAALAKAVADPPDLVLADVSLPGLSGLELVTALRGDPRTSLVPVVLMSARAGPEAAVEGLGAGADDYLVTPFSARELRARVDGRVALGRARREAERRFQAMADSTPALIWADGPGGQRLFVNRGWLEFTGAEPDADLGLAWQERIHPADRAHYDRVRATAAGGPFEVEYRLRAASGHYRWVLDRGAPAEGHVGGYVGGCLDIDSRVGERERQRLLAVVGAALDRETTVEGRRRTLVRTLVDEGLADMARFVEISDGQPTDGRAIAAHSPSRRRCCTSSTPTGWGRARPRPARSGSTRSTRPSSSPAAPTSGNGNCGAASGSARSRSSRSTPAARPRACSRSPGAAAPPRSTTATSRCSATSRNAQQRRWTTPRCWSASRPTGHGSRCCSGPPRRCPPRPHPSRSRRRRPSSSPVWPGRVRSRCGSCATRTTAQCSNPCSTRPATRPPAVGGSRSPSRSPPPRPPAHASPCGPSRAATPPTASPWSLPAPASAWSGSAGSGTCAPAPHAPH